MYFGLVVCQLPSFFVKAFQGKEIICVFDDI